MAVFTLTNLDNVFTGTAAADTIFALRGGDDIIAGGGDDSVEGGFGDDQIEGGGGNDSLLGEEGTDVVLGGAGNDLLDGGIGDDRLDGGDGNDIVRGSVGADLIVGAAGNDTIDGGIDGDQIDAGAGDDIADGDVGADRISGGSGADTLRGFTDNDLIYGDATGDINGVAEPSIPDITTVGSTTIPGTGQAFNVSLTVTDATNSTSTNISGLVSTGRVSSSLFNIAYVIDVSGSTTAAFGGTPVGDVNGDGVFDTILDAEIDSLIRLNNEIVSRFGGANVDVTLIAFDDIARRTINLTQAGVDSDFDGQTNVEEALRGLRALNLTNFEAPLIEALDFFQTDAGAGNNFVFFLSDGFSNAGGTFNNESVQLRAAPINATIRSVGVGSGASLAQLDLLDDGIANSSAQRVLNPADLNAAVLGSPITPAQVDRVEVLLNGVVVQTIPSSSLVSTPLGLQYNLSLNGLSPTAADTIQVRAVATGSGAQTTVSTSQVVEQVPVGSSSDVIDGGSGDDMLYGATGDDTVRGGTGNDQLFGGEGNDRLNGQTGDDFILGGNGRDTVLAGEGDDEIVGGFGIDRLLGGTGADTFIYALREELGDVIVDFTNNVDRIDVSELLGGVGYAGNNPIADQVIRFLANAGGTDIVFDVDGLGFQAPVLLASLRGVAVGLLDASDFTFV